MPEQSFPVKSSFEGTCPEFLLCPAKSKTSLPGTGTKPAVLEELATGAKPAMCAGRDVVTKFFPIFLVRFCVGQDFELCQRLPHTSQPADPCEAEVLKFWKVPAGERSTCGGTMPFSKAACCCIRIPSLPGPFPGPLPFPAPRNAIPFPFLPLRPPLPLPFRPLPK